MLEQKVNLPNVAELSIYKEVKIAKIADEADRDRALRQYIDWLQANKGNVVVIDRIFEFGHHYKIIVLYQEIDDGPVDWLYVSRPKPADPAK